MGPFSFCSVVCSRQCQEGAAPGGNALTHLGWGRRSTPPQLGPQSGHTPTLGPPPPSGTDDPRDPPAQLTGKSKRTLPDPGNHRRQTDPAGSQIPDFGLGASVRTWACPHRAHGGTGPSSERLGSDRVQEYGTVSCDSAWEHASQAHTNPCQKHPKSTELLQKTGVRPPELPPP